MVQSVSYIAEGFKLARNTKDRGWAAMGSPSIMINLTMEKIYAIFKMVESLHARRAYGKVSELLESSYATRARVSCW
jgi:hypothetical protein